MPWWKRQPSGDAVWFVGLAHLVVLVVAVVVIHGYGADAPLGMPMARWAPVPVAMPTPMPTPKLAAAAVHQPPKPVLSPPATTQVTSAQWGPLHVYTVRPGDEVPLVAAEFGLAVDQLHLFAYGTIMPPASANAIRPGALLIVPTGT